MPCSIRPTSPAPTRTKAGLVRYGSEPGTCEESALTGLPQVTVPAGFFGGRFPMGISLLGRSWDDKRLLEMAAAYERADNTPSPATNGEVINRRICDTSR